MHCEMRILTRVIQKCILKNRTPDIVSVVLLLVERMVLDAELAVEMYLALPLLQLTIHFDS